jgi:outer membrane protein assembly factor BamB
VSGEPPARRGRVRFLAFPFLTGILAACSGDVIGEFPSPPPPAITASPTPQLDEGILAEISVDGSPCFLAEAGGHVWVTAFDGNELIEIDPTTNRVVRTYRMPGGPCGMAERDGTLWIETPNAGSLVAFDPARGEVIDRIRIPGGVVGVTSTRSGLWGVAGESGQVVQIDPDSRQVVARVDVEATGGLAVGGDQIWAVAGRSELVRIDPGSHSIAERIELESFEPEGLAIGRNLLWVSSSFEGNVLRVDLRTGRVRDRLPVDGSLFGGIVIGDSYWISGNNGTIYRLDAGSGEVVDQLDLVGFGPIPAAGNLWTVDLLSNTVFRLDEDAD